MMKIENDLLKQIAEDIGINVPYIKGQKIQVRNCWHFSTDGRAVDVMFYDDEDFRSGMKRVFVVLQNYKVVVLSFCLMDNHIHFVLYGTYDECNRFIHEYIRRTSMAIQKRHGDSKKLLGLPISHQKISDDSYLKIVICYVIKNPPVAGIPFNAYDYPWSSGALYFRKQGYWTSPQWIYSGNLDTKSGDALERRKYLKSRFHRLDGVLNIDDMVYPGEYVAFELVESLFRTHKSFNYFMSKTKEEDVESRGGILSHLSVPRKEMRQHKNEVCKELFGISSTKNLDMRRRMILAKTLKSRYYCSSKQIADLCGLVYEEVKHLL